jgi:hypothetical protein
MSGQDFRDKAGRNFRPTAGLPQIDCYLFLNPGQGKKFRTGSRATINNNNNNNKNINNIAI